MKLSKDDIRIAKKRSQDLRRNPPKVTQEHRNKAKDLEKQQIAFEESKDRDIVRERKALSKDIAGYVYNQYQGVGAKFHGIGEGKKVYCAFPGCGKHEGTMHNMKDNKWYDSEHRWFGDLNEQEKEKELSCLKIS